MTILGVRNQLVSHFLGHDTFDPVKHAMEVQYDKDTADFRDQLLSLALADLEASGFVKRVNRLLDNGEEKSVWVLVQPINSYVQNVPISPVAAEVISNVVNFHNELDEIDVQCDKLKIDEQDIMRLIQIVSEYDDEEFGGEEQGAQQEERE